MEVVPRPASMIDKVSDQADESAGQLAIPGASDSEIKSATHMFMLFSVLFLLAFSLWAAFCRLDIMSVANGEVVPSGYIKRVQHLEGGIVKKILVKEGELVKKDQALVEMETIASESSVNELKVRNASLRINIARLSAELEDRETVDFDKDLTANNANLVEQARGLFFANREQLQNSLKSQDQLIAQRSQSYKELEVRVRNEKERRDLLKEQIEISKSLLKDDLTSRYQHLELLKQANVLDGSIEENSLAMTRVESALAEQQSKKKELISTYKKGVQAELEKNRQDKEELAERMKKFQDSLHRSVLRSPVDGIVKTLYVVTEGGVVPPGATLMDVVPQDALLIIEAKLSTRDIGYVKVGQTAQIRLSSADAYKYGALEGKVTAISPDTFTGPQGGAPYYKVSVTTSKTFFSNGNARYMLSPGLLLEVSIQTGERTVLQYIFDPVLSSSREAMTER